jgi:hypothetical protein
MMNPQKLKLDEVRVESFETGSAEPLRGTVEGHEALLATRIIKCGTNGGPYCETQKLTGPCGC